MRHFATTETCGNDHKATPPPGCGGGRPGFAGRVGGDLYPVGAFRDYLTPQEQLTSFLLLYSTRPRITHRRSACSWQTGDLTVRRSQWPWPAEFVVNGAP